MLDVFRTLVKQLRNSIYDSAASEEVGPIPVRLLLLLCHRMKGSAQLWCRWWDSLQL